ncbi:helix-turn-helix domain-containing protein [Candidatus Pacearchaeota archaeon]|nr:helix-turn-helix domain-containing protein [Candidatus Pacearchaeota archaeon]
MSKTIEQKTLSDEKLIIQKAVERDPIAIGQIYEFYRPKIQRFVRRKRYEILNSSDPEEAWDVTEEVFLRAFENISEYTDLGFHFSSFLYRIAGNFIIDEQRKHKRITEFKVEKTGRGIHSIYESAPYLPIIAGRINKAIESLEPDCELPTD